MWNIKFVFKSLKKSFSITFINILGFSLGLCVIFFLTRYLLNEFSYNSFHQDKERIYRVAVKSYQENNFTDETFVYTSEVGKSLMADFPDVDQYATITYPKTDIFYFDNRPVKIEEYLYASEAFFDFFTFHLKEGNPQNVLKEPFSLVVTEQLSEKLFGIVDPVGKQLVFNGDLYTVTGVAENPPANSDIRFNMLVSLSTRHRQKNVYMGWMGGNQYIHFIKLIPETDLALLYEKMPDPFMWKYINKDYDPYGIKDELYLQPISEIHLQYNPDSASLRRSMLVFSVIAVLLLAVVIINFINLFIADSTKRLKTMGIIKIHGADKSRMIRYLLTEIAVLIMASFLLAFSLVKIFHPYFEQLAGKTIPSFSENGLIYSLVIIAAILVVSLLAAFFPAVLISSVQPAKIIKNEMASGRSGKTLKNGL
ncbi:MAG: ABC transporter permease, partial [Prolixibacteraceae bacterium]|nr:ABC transporter permease [Prolixibacteraceae bacterium]